MLIFVSPAHQKNLIMLQSNTIPTLSDSDSAFSSDVDINSSMDQHATENFQSITAPIHSDSKKKRRGRPKSDEIPDLILDGHTSNSSIKCQICNRVFPRPKSLQAHNRTHTGERPFVCDYPSCTKAFAQSGHLKTHQLLHTGERPFMCPTEGCQVRHTHGNRRCQIHPEVQLVRDEEKRANFENMENMDSLVVQWHLKYLAKRTEKTSSKGQKRKTTKTKDENPAKKPRLQSESEESGYSNISQTDSENCYESAVVVENSRSLISDKILPPYRCAPGKEMRLQTVYKELVNMQRSFEVVDDDPSVVIAKVTQAEYESISSLFELLKSPGPVQ